jgi:L-fucose dehydrogenase
MNLDLENKVFLITGGGSGIGAAIVQQLAEEGAIPVIIDKNEAASKKVIQDISAKGKKGDYIIKDLSKKENCEAGVLYTIKKYNRLDGIINNAGANDSVGLETGNPDAFVASFHRNLFHYYYMVHYALPYLKQTKGAIINIASKTAITGQGGTSAYAAAKGGQLALTREWAVELLKYGIRVNAIIPSEVMTPMYRNWIDTFDDPDKKLASIEARIPFESRMTKPEEIADSAVFLLSKRASHITGQQLYIDGGYVHLDRSASVLNKTNL